jgi:hypothetical protein
LETGDGVIAKAKFPKNVIIVLADCWGRGRDAWPAVA